MRRSLLPIVDIRQCETFCGTVRAHRFLHERTIEATPGWEANIDPLSLAARTVPLVSAEFDRESARRLAELLRAGLRVDAVEIVLDDHIAAFSGIGADHHRPGLPYRTALVGRALRDGQPIWARGMRSVGCVVPHCQLISGFAVPCARTSRGRLIITLLCSRRQPLSVTVRRTMLGLSEVWEALQQDRQAGSVVAQAVSSA